MHAQGKFTGVAVIVTEDIYTAGLSQCHIDLLVQLQIRANLVVPILQEESLQRF
jgi:GAF domain-containing protein